MVTPTLSALTVYPIKSCLGNSLTSVSVSPVGLQDDRRFAVVDIQDELLTAREIPGLLGIEVKCSSTELMLELDQLEWRVPLLSPPNEKIRIRFFSETVTVTEVGDGVADWLSDRLGVRCKLVEIDQSPGRFVLPRRGGLAGDKMALADECPILVVSEASLDDLNSRLPSPIDMRQFRPNLVIKDCDPFFEDTLTSFQLGDVEFDVTQQCKRCDLATIHPDRREKDSNQEPLRTLATYRRNREGKVTFGVHAIPRSSGTLQLGLPLTVGRLGST